MKVFKWFYAFMITFALLAVSTFSFMSSFNTFKFPKRAATCTAVSPF